MELKTHKGWNAIKSINQYILLQFKKYQDALKTSVNSKLKSCEYIEIQWNQNFMLILMILFRKARRILISYLCNLKNVNDIKRNSAQM